MKMLISCDYFMPGWKAGGPIRFLKNLIEEIGDEIKCRVITRDRDWGEKKPYHNIILNKWQMMGKSEVLYLSGKRKSFQTWLKILHNSDYDLIFLNSYFSPKFTIIPLFLRKIKLIPPIPILLAPNGELSEGALAIKSLKKRMFLAFSRVSGLYNEINWLSYSKMEMKDISRIIKKPKKEILLPPIIKPRNYLAERAIVFKKYQKKKEQLKIVFMSRICKMKNLKGAINILKGVRGRIIFDIYGPLQEKKYWEECQKLILKLPKEIVVQYQGVISPEKVLLKLSKYELFFLPTFGENYGNVILESLLAGCPILISDRTPWRNLRERGIGYDLPLDRPEEFQKVISNFLEMDEETHQEWCRRAKNYGQELILKNQEGLAKRYREVFLKFKRNSANEKWNEK